MPATGTCWDVGVRAPSVQGAPAWATANVTPSMTRLPWRSEDVGLAATDTLTVPLLLRHGEGAGVIQPSGVATDGGLQVTPSAPVPDTLRTAAPALEVNVLEPAGFTV